MNRINLTGRLTHDPELVELTSGKVCKVRLAVDSMGRGNEVGYVDVASYGPSGEAAARTLRKGAQVAVDGRLEWRTWEQGETTRQAYSVVGHIEFLSPAKKADEDPGAELPLVPVAAGAHASGDDDIPF